MTRLLGIALFAAAAAVACIANSGKNQSPPPAAAAPITSTDTLASAPADGGLVSCDTFVVRSKTLYDGCNNKCQDDQRNQQRNCNDPNCLSGIGNFTRQCVAKCESDRKAAKDAHCFLDE